MIFGTAPESEVSLQAEDVPGNPNMMTKVIPVLASRRLEA